MFGANPHDTVVPQSSSVAPRLGAVLTADVTCDHFSYFQLPGQVTTQEARRLAIAYLWSQVDFPKAIVAAANSFVSPGRIFSNSFRTSTFS